MNFFHSSLSLILVALTFILPFVLNQTTCAEETAPHIPDTSAATVTERMFLYADDEDQKINAELFATLTRTPDGKGQLHLRLSASGPFVDPQPGFTGLRGYNRHTAFQLQALTDPHGLFYIATSDPSGKFIGGHATVRRQYGSMPQRKLNRDGSIDYFYIPPQSFLLQIDTSTRALPPGSYVTEIWARNEPRLRVRYELTPDRSRILRMENLGHVPADQKLTPPGDDNGKWHFVQDPPAPSKPPEVNPMPENEWRKLSTAEKWAKFDQAVGEHPEQEKGWIDYLFRIKDYDFLEQLGLHRVGAFETGGIGNRLKQENAPQWIRLTIWMRKASLGHTSSVVDQILYAEDSRDDMYSYMKKYPDLLNVARNKEVFRRHEKNEAKNVDVSRFLPPLKWEDVLGHLDSEDASVPERKRAIQGVIVRAEFEEPWIGKILRLAEHNEESVRQSALLAFTQFPSEKIPMRRLLTWIDSEEEGKKIRESALLAHSYGEDRAAYPTLLRIAGDRDHPAWAAAVSRLGDLGDDYALNLLSDLSVEPGEELLTRAQTRIIERASKLNDSRVASQMIRKLTRVAWAEENQLALAPSLKDWTFALIREYAGSQKVKNRFEAWKRVCSGQDNPPHDINPAMKKTLCAYLEALQNDSDESKE